jgi:ribonuclease P protein component
MQRLKTRPQFQAVLAGALVGKTSHFALHKLDLSVLDAASKTALFSASDSWIGAMAPKRWAKRAVTRNAIKRQIYTVCTKLEPASIQTAFLVRLRREFSRADFVSASSPALKEAIRQELQLMMTSYEALK